MVIYIRSEDGGIEPDLQYEEVLKRLADKYVAEGEREKVKAELRLDAVIKRLIRDGKLKNWYITERYNGISPAPVLVFDDLKHPVMPIREYRWQEYLPILPPRGD